ncbi:MerR family transcriptional regulator/heat shock protein HspR [Stackebrandtia albiflava]|uniref:MerR family transcriptional regulator/heat shock protein HspR n=1 Tax=Stackebrandtia albiflava TaxID=406432 RepID=A0A562V0L7_9ACTN|nr:helix-turn-helix transcriptional regulator [Stackebrandtia albiflava]TWJ11449.1 MerR family transcriptional regulator/heat shock protein HspR [Stackebrandtia albiflava]
MAKQTRRSAEQPPMSDAALDAKVLVISVAAEMAGMHPQTLRQYDRLGLVQPSRTTGGGRRYSVRDVAQLREIQRLSQEDGVNLAGIKRIMQLEHQVSALRVHVNELMAHVESMEDERAELEAAIGPFRLARRTKVSRETALVVWRPHQH